jgi:hypothetical protein
MNILKIRDSKRFSYKECCFVGYNTLQSVRCETDASEEYIASFSGSKNKLCKKPD